MRDVDVDTCISSSVGIVSALAARDARWVPEVGPVGIVDTGSRADNVDLTEFLYADGEHTL